MHLIGRSCGGIIIFESGSDGLISHIIACHFPRSCLFNLIIIGAKHPQTINAQRLHSHIISVSHPHFLQCIHFLLLLARLHLQNQRILRPQAFKMCIPAVFQKVQTHERSVPVSGPIGDGIHGPHRILIHFKSGIRQHDFYARIQQIPSEWGIPFLGDGQGDASHRHDHELIFVHGPNHMIEGQQLFIG